MFNPSLVQDRSRVLARALTAETLGDGAHCRRQSTPVFRCNKWSDLVA